MLSQIFIFYIVSGENTFCWNMPNQTNGFSTVPNNMISPRSGQLCRGPQRCVMKDNINRLAYHNWQGPHEERKLFYMLSVLSQSNKEYYNIDLMT